MQSTSRQYPHAMQMHELRPELLADARARLVSGLKRYFHQKHVEGLLSSKVSSHRRLVLPSCLRLGVCGDLACHWLLQTALTACCCTAAQPLHTTRHVPCCMQGMRILDNACDIAIDKADRPLDLWVTLEK